MSFFEAKLDLSRLTTIFFLFLGLIGYGIFYFGFNPVNFTTSRLGWVLIHEFVSVSKPVALSIAPSFFIILKINFKNAPTKILILLTGVLGAIFIFPPYIHNMTRWRPLLQTINNLPVTGLRFHRSTGRFPDVSPATLVKVTVPESSLADVERTIEARITQNQSKLLKYKDPHSTSTIVIKVQ